jgi:GNAT superfamily N-acetyltransferase
MIEVREIRHVQTTTRVFAAFDQEGLSRRFPVGFITVDDRDDLVEMVYVTEHYRRQGVATLLLEEARRVTGLALDADRGDRTLAGSRWCRANGIRVAQGYRRIPDRDMAGMGARMMLQILYARQEEVA